jgi:hypothetical protein
LRRREETGGGERREETGDRGEERGKSKEQKIGFKFLLFAP